MKLQRSNRENFLESLKKFDLYPKKHMVFNITVKTELNVKKKIKHTMRILYQKANMAI